MGRSKYPSLGILDALDNLVSGGITREALAFDLKHYPQYSPRQFSRELYRLKSRKFIRTNSVGKLTLDVKGRELQKIRLLARVALRNKKTDGYSRLIIFDIPEKLRGARNILRDKLREFECKQLQRSVYITPYVCEDELKEVNRILRVERYVHVLKIVPL